MKEEMRWMRCLRSSEHCSGGLIGWGVGGRQGQEKGIQGLISAPFHETMSTCGSEARDMNWLWKDMPLSRSSGPSGSLSCGGAGSQAELLRDSSLEPQSP